MAQEYTVTQWDGALSDQQLSFAGGMNSTSDPMYLSEDQYAYGKNIEVRKMTAATRRGHRYYRGFKAYVTVGSVSLPTPMIVDTTNPPQGWCSFIHPTHGRVTLFVVDKTIQMIVPNFPGVTTFTHPTIYTTGEVKLVVAYKKVYMMPGDGNPVLEWDGTNPWMATALPTVAGQEGINTRSTLAVWFQDRLWVVKDSDSIIASQYNAPTIFDPATDEVEISSGEDDGIVQIYAWRNKEILILKSQSVYVLGAIYGDIIATGLPTAATLEIISKHGCVAKDSVVEVGTDVWYFSRRGVEALRRNENDKAIGIDLPVSVPIQSEIDKINWDYAHKIAAGLADNYVLFSVPQSATYCNTVLAFDLVRKVWVGAWTGLNAMAFLADVPYGGQDVPMFLKNTGGLYRLLVGNKDEAGPIAEQEIHSRYFVHQLPVNDKSQRNLEIVTDTVSPEFTVKLRGLAFGKEATLAEKRKLFNSRTRKTVELGSLYTDTVLADSPIGYWKMDDYTAVTCKDYSGNSRDLEYLGNPTVGQDSLLKGDSGYSVALDGTGDRIVMDSGTFANTTSAFSVDAWVKIDVQRLTGRHGIYRLVATDNILFCVDIGGYMGFYYQGQVVNGTTVLEVGKTYYVCATMADNDAMRVYVNGILEGTLAVGTLGPVTATGALQLGRAGTAATHIDGYLDEVAAYTTQLSQARITAHYDAGMGRLTADVVAYDDASTDLPLSLPFDLNPSTTSRWTYPHQLTDDLGYQVKITNSKGEFGLRQVSARGLINAFGRRNM